MRSTVDVNVLVYAADAGSPWHGRAREALQRIAAGPAITYLFWPVLLGYLRIVTHPSIVGSPLAPAVVLDGLDDLVSRPHVVVPGEGDLFWPTLRSVADEVSPRGNLVPDAHLVALMREHGVGRILTRDRDFRRFDGIVVEDPFEEPST